MIFRWTLVVSQYTGIDSNQGNKIIKILIVDIVQKKFQHMFKLFLLKAQCVIFLDLLTEMQYKYTKNIIFV